MRRRTFLGSMAAAATATATSSTIAPLRLGMAGLVHGHAGGFLSRYGKDKTIDLVGVAEPDREVAGRYAEQFRIDGARLYPSVAEMLDRAKPEGVVVFTSTADHAAVVSECARRRIPVMMEKPLAISAEAAHAIAREAKAASIPVLVNYETTWYPANHEAYALAKAGALGPIRKVVAHDGHRGPKEIGVQPEFLDWLTDPARNGAGALFDFGCYGANLMTWLMDDERPRSVTAVVQTMKPAVYRGVDDEATVILEYPNAQAILQASWNWPFDRKDLEIYGATGQAITSGRDGLRVRLAGKPEEARTPPPLVAPRDDFLRCFTAVVRGEARPSGLSSLKNNVVVTEILDAARRSATTGRTVRLG